MPTMKSVRTAAPGTIEMAEIQRSVPGPRDLLVRVCACGICGTDAAFVQMRGMPLGPGRETASIPLGHEPAGTAPLRTSAVSGEEFPQLAQGKTDAQIISDGEADCSDMAANWTMTTPSMAQLICGVKSEAAFRRFAIHLVAVFATAGPMAGFFRRTGAS
jgi:D-arabinose 1-dehydrogenase-like Zn-dependent alcohol dehydrogenase